ARRLAPAPAALVHAPPAVHAQVRVERELALEADEEMLALRVPRAHGPSREPLGPAVAREARVRRLYGGDPLPDQRASDSPRGAVDGVALGHGSRVEPTARAASHV